MLSGALKHQLSASKMIKLFFYNVNFKTEKVDEFGQGQHHPTLCRTAKYDPDLCNILDLVIQNGPKCKAGGRFATMRCQIKLQPCNQHQTIVETLLIPILDIWFEIQGLK